MTSDNMKMSQDASKYTDAQHVSNLVIMVGRLVQQVRKHEQDNPTVRQAMDYLRRANLMPTMLRGVTENIGLPTPAPKRVPVRLYWYDGNIVGRYDHSPPTDPSFREIKFDGSGFYVTQGDG